MCTFYLILGTLGMLQTILTELRQNEERFKKIEDLVTEMCVTEMCGTETTPIQLKRKAPSRTVRVGYRCCSSLLTNTSLHLFRTLLGKHIEVCMRVMTHLDGIQRMFSRIGSNIISMI